ncbi:MAG: dipeptidase PepV [Acholeplasmataceae bacterium]|nr:dipeptidase PepV [Acholeplasmataceae bacterium]
MNINFKVEVLKRKEEILKDLTGLIKINSEMTTYDPNRKGAPFGEGIKDALDYMIQLGEKDGFDCVNLDGYAGHISYGNQKEYVGTIGHLDVVPAGNDWTFPAYGAVIDDNKMYGRGTEDDKGPTIAIYYALKILKELDVKLSKRIKLILGTDEETAWRGVRHYFSVYPEIPVSGFIPDADFPLIYAEKGISRIFVEGDLKGSDLVDVKGGFRDNMVPDYAEAKLKPNKDYQKLFNAFLKANTYQGTFEEKDGLSCVKVFGKSAHGSTPQFGENAIDRLFEFLNDAKVNHPIVKLACDRLIHDIHGQKLGVAYKDEEMGHLTINLGAMSTIDGKYRFNLNLRYPNGVKFDEVVSTLKESVKSYGSTVTVDNHQELLYIDPKSELVQKLLKVYRKHTNDFSDPITIGGGTFARALPNSVAFGPHFLEKPTYIHQKNEFIDLDDFFMAIMIYTEALYELAK